MPRTLVVGIGNPLRQDDGVGRRIAEALAGLSSHQLTVELAEPLSRVDRAVFIDAADTGDPPGTVSCRVLYPAEAALTLSHHLTPSVLLALARHLYGRCPEAVWV